LTLPDGIVVNYGYDQASELTGLTYSLAGNVLGNLAYAYDADGRRTQMSGSWARTGMPNPTTNTAVYNAANELSNWNGATLAYDASGNMTSDGTNAYTWDPRNQLASISGNFTASFQYDPFGRRLGKTINGSTANFLYDGVNPVQELVGGSPSANLLTGPGADEYFQRTGLTGTSNFLTDALGSTLALADPTGTVQTQYTYDPFGGATTQGTANANSFQFTGRENDGDGLDYYRARYYDPMVARFISQDPLDISGGGPNLYGYAMNSPVIYIDPMGLHMSCTFCQDTGTFSCTDTDTGQPVVRPTNKGVYSGGDEGRFPFCVNNPGCQGIGYAGPIPAGTWEIGAPVHTRLGDPTFPLSPAPGTDNLGRTGLLIHAPNAKKDRTGQNSLQGCIVTPLDVRAAMKKAWSNGDTLNVTTCQ
jgi:RHS repeat-associated protein